MCLKDIKHVLFKLGATKGAPAGFFFPTKKHARMFFLRCEGYDLEMKPSSLSGKYCVETTLSSLKVDSLKVDILKSRSRRMSPNPSLKVDLVKSRFAKSRAR